MSSLYSPTVAKAFREVKKPLPFTVNLVELPDFLYLSVYADEILSFSDDQREAVMMWLLATKKRIEDLGVRCEIAGHDGPPPKR